MAEETKEEQVTEQVTEQASDVTTFYRALIDGGVPELFAGPMAQEFNHQSLRAHYRQ